MNKLALYLVWLTIATLNAILLISASSLGQVLGQSSSFALLVNVMYAALLSSSAMLCYVKIKANGVMCFALVI